MVASSVVDSAFDPQSGQTKFYKIGICCVFTKHCGVRTKPGEVTTKPGGVRTKPGLFRVWI
jgi:hypothetical protein